MVGEVEVIGTDRIDRAVQGRRLQPEDPDDAALARPGPGHAGQPQAFMSGHGLTATGTQFDDRHDSPQGHRPIAVLSRQHDDIAADGGDESCHERAPA